MDYFLENSKLDAAKIEALKNNSKTTIGLLQEHTLHRILKFYICNDVNKQEVSVGKMYADVLIDSTIYEVQTKSFNLMRDKLKLFLKNYEVTIVYPVASNKTIYLMDDNGELISKKKSPKHANELEIMKELYRIKNYLLSPNLHFKIILLDIDEYRKQVKKPYYRSKGYERTDQIPNHIINIYDIKETKDFKEILKNYNLPKVFSSKDFSKHTHLSYSKASTALNVLNYLNVVTRIGKEKNSYLYEIV